MRIPDQNGGEKSTISTEPQWLQVVRAIIAKKKSISKEVEENDVSTR